MNLAPNAAEPYLTIARIYEDQEDHEKAFEVCFVLMNCREEQRVKFVNFWFR